MSGGQLPDLGVFPIRSLRKLEHLVGVDRNVLRDLSENVDSLYRSHTIKKKSGAPRQIDNPQRRLKLVQSYICTRLLQSITFPSTMYGGIRGFSSKQHAALHVGQPEVVTLDLTDCFPRIDHKKVFKVFLELLGCVEPIARLLTRLTTYQGHIPQGAPTSPLVSNLCLVGVHCQISSLAQERGLLFSQYFDDLAISGKNAREIIGEVISLLQADGHKVNRKKILCMHSGDRQEVTGIIVNRKLSTRATKHRDARQRILDFNPSSKDADTVQRSIQGSINYVDHINPTQGASLRRLIEKSSVKGMKSR